MKSIENFKYYEKKKKKITITWDDRIFFQVIRKFFDRFLLSKHNFVFF